MEIDRAAAHRIDSVDRQSGRLGLVDLQLASIRAAIGEIEAATADDEALSEEEKAASGAV